MKNLKDARQWQLLPDSFYRRPDVLQIAEELLGKILCTRMDGEYTAGRIVETEAYAGVTDRASHAFGGRRTARVEPMYGPGGHSYVYLCYGIHHLFNVVTNEPGIPHAVLIRALEPIDGQKLMQERTGSKQLRALARGPGKLARALGITTAHTAQSLQGPLIQLWDDGFRFPAEQVARGPRIGVDYAGDDAFLPYRFYIRQHPDVSGKKEPAVRQ